MVNQAVSALHQTAYKFDPMLTESVAFYPERQTVEKARHAAVGRKVVLYPGEIVCRLVYCPVPWITEGAPPVAAVGAATAA